MSIKDLLRQFNRKERHWLVCDALGDGAASLAEGFLDKVEAQVKLVDRHFKFDASPYWAIDFHLDWLVGVLHKLKNPHIKDAVRHLNVGEMVKGTQEDIDLVIATGDTLLLIEAKGEGAWSSEQLRSKMERLRSMTGELIGADGCVDRMRIVFLLCSPRGAPRKPLDFNCPSWVLVDGRFLHFHLRRPKGSFLAVTRCDVGGPSRKATHWMIQKTSRWSTQDEVTAT